ncbi:MAG: riboflavin biosynthesis protein RibF [Bacteroidetes bacterium 46-16]|nr:MAG: riboflavin biosynthesis protein RibF [Bacteroidetes bacterium 46-16]
MALYFDIDSLPRFEHAVLTIGTFDGVHLGHRTILDEVVRHTKSVKGESIVITFEPHPRKLLFPGQPIKLITPLQQKLDLIVKAGIHHVVVAPFTREFSQLSATEYIRDFLVKKFQPHSIVIGYDHHFGHDRKGDINLLKEQSAEYGYKVFEIPAQLIDEAAVSSTKIRKALAEGRISDAGHMLGRNYTISGTVIEGNKLGRTIGYPTANIRHSEPEQILPAIGIYAVYARWQGTSFKGMLSIGHNPTVTDDKSIKIEVNIFNFDKEIYGDMLEIEFVARLRDEEKFDSLEALKDQLHRDKEYSISVLK